MFLYQVNLKGIITLIHAKNEAQLKYAIDALTDVFEESPDLLDEYPRSTPDTEKDTLINSAAIGRPYPYG